MRANFSHRTRFTSSAKFKHSSIFPHYGYWYWYASMWYSLIQCPCLLKFNYVWRQRNHLVTNIHEKHPRNFSRRFYFISNTLIEYFNLIKKYYFRTFISVKSINKPSKIIYAFGDDNHRPYSKIFMIAIALVLDEKTPIISINAIV